MINRASVPMWGIAGKSAGPPKSAGKKSCRRPLYQIWRHGSDFIYTKNPARPGSGFYLHNFFRGLFGKKLLRKMTDILCILKNFPRCARLFLKESIKIHQGILKIFRAAREKSGSVSANSCAKWKVQYFRISEFQNPGPPDPLCTRSKIRW